jgi:hypothetical protein
VDAAYVEQRRDSHVVICVLAREHGLVDRDELFRVEDALAKRFVSRTFTLSVRAHQGRVLSAIAGDRALLPLQPGTT